MGHSMRPQHTGYVRVLFVAAAIALVAAGSVSAQEPTATDLAKTVQNPIGAIYSFPFQNNTTFGVGPADATFNTLNIQPVIPTPLSSKILLINRAIIPVKYVGEAVEGQGTASGLGDITIELPFTAAAPGKVIWGIGPAFILPTATDDRLGAGKWQAGLLGVILTMPGHWVIGALAQNTWSFAGDEARADVNFFFSQYFVNYNLADGWYLTSSPIITANWEAESGEQWTVPVGGGFGKVQKFKIPVNFQIQAFYNAVKPDPAGDWSLRLQIQPMIPIKQ